MVKQGSILNHETKQNRTMLPQILPPHLTVFSDGAGDIASNLDMGDQATVLFVIGDLVGSSSLLHLAAHDARRRFRHLDFRIPHARPLLP